MSQVRLKAILEGEDARIFSVHDSISYGELVSMLCERFDQHVTIAKYVDDEGDVITLDRESDLHEAFSLYSSWKNRKPLVLKLAAINPPQVVDDIGGSRSIGDMHERSSDGSGGGQSYLVYHQPDTWQGHNYRQEYHDPSSSTVSASSNPESMAGQVSSMEQPYSDSRSSELSFNLRSRVAIPRLPDELDSENPRSYRDYHYSPHHQLHGSASPSRNLEMDERPQSPLEPSRSSDDYYKTERSVPRTQSHHALRQPLEGNTRQRSRSDASDLSGNELDPTIVSRQLPHRFHHKPTSPSLSPATSHPASPTRSPPDRKKRTRRLHGDGETALDSRRGITTTTPLVYSHSPTNSPPSLSPSRSPSSSSRFYTSPFGPRSRSSFSHYSSVAEARVSSVSSPVVGDSIVRSISAHSRAYYNPSDDDFPSGDDFSQGGRRRALSSAGPVSVHYASGESSYTSTVHSETATTSTNEMSRFTSSDTSSLRSQQQKLEENSCEARRSMSNNICETEDEIEVYFQNLKWQRGKLLGKGAFGDVYLGLLETGELVAVKEMELNVDANPKETERKFASLRSEISIMRRLNHPNIIRYLCVQQEGRRIYLMMECALGGSIRHFLNMFGCFPEEVIRRYTTQIVDGLIYLHANNVIHRDIKGANILVDYNRTIKLSDFGCSKINTLNFNNDNKSVIGTPHWMAPEVIRGSHGMAADIWSLGCTLVEMATGKPPHADEESMAVLFKIASSTSPPEPPSHLSHSCRDFISRCLCMDPAKRPSARALSRHSFLTAQQQISQLQRQHPLSSPLMGSSFGSIAAQQQQQHPPFALMGDATRSPSTPSFHLHPQSQGRITSMPLSHHALTEGVNHMNARPSSVYSTLSSHQQQPKQRYDEHQQETDGVDSRYVSLLRRPSVSSIHAATLSDLHTAKAVSLSLAFMPRELTLRIFSFMSAEELSVVARVSKKWRDIAYCPLLWESIVTKRPIDDDELSEFAASSGNASLPRLSSSLLSSKLQSYLNSSKEGAKRKDSSNSSSVFSQTPSSIASSLSNSLSSSNSITIPWTSNSPTRLSSSDPLHGMEWKDTIGWRLFYIERILRARRYGASSFEDREKGKRPQQSSVATTVLKAKHTVRSLVAILDCAETRSSSPTSMPFSLPPSLFFCSGQKRVRCVPVPIAALPSPRSSSGHAKRVICNERGKEFSKSSSPVSVLCLHSHAGHPIVVCGFKNGDVSVFRLTVGDLMESKRKNASKKRGYSSPILKHSKAHSRSISTVTASHCHRSLCILPSAVRSHTHSCSFITGDNGGGIKIWRMDIRSLFSTSSASSSSSAPFAAASSTNSSSNSHSPSSASSLTLMASVVLSSAALTSSSSSLSVKCIVCPYLTLSSHSAGYLQPQETHADKTHPHSIVATASAPALSVHVVQRSASSSSPSSHRRNSNKNDGNSDHAMMESTAPLNLSPTRWCLIALTDGGRLFTVRSSSSTTSSASDLLSVREKHSQQQPSLEEWPCTVDGTCCVSSMALLSPRMLVVCLGEREQQEMRIHHLTGELMNGTDKNAQCLLTAAVPPDTTITSLSSVPPLRRCHTLFSSVITALSRSYTTTNAKDSSPSSSSSSSSSAASDSDSSSSLSPSSPSSSAPHTCGECLSPLPSVWAGSGNGQLHLWTTDSPDPFSVRSFRCVRTLCSSPSSSSASSSSSSSTTDVDGDGKDDKDEDRDSTAATSSKEPRRRRAISSVSATSVRPFRRRTATGSPLPSPSSSSSAATTLDNNSSTPLTPVASGENAAPSSSAFAVEGMYVTDRHVVSYHRNRNIVLWSC